MAPRHELLDGDPLVDRGHQHRDLGIRSSSTGTSKVTSGSVGEVNARTPGTAHAASSPAGTSVPTGVSESSTSGTRVTLTMEGLPRRIGEARWPPDSADSARSVYGVSTSFAYSICAENLSTPLKSPSVGVPTRTSGESCGGRTPNRTYPVVLRQRASGARLDAVIRQVCTQSLSIGLHSSSSVWPVPDRPKPPALTSLIRSSTSCESICAAPEVR